MDPKAQFSKIYANLPLNQRSEIIAVVDDEPFSWNSARIEIDNNTEKGQEILKKLLNMKLLS